MQTATRIMAAMTMQIAIITFLVSFATITGWLLCREPAQITQFETPNPPDKPSPSQPAVNELLQKPIEQDEIIAVSEAELYIKKKLLIIIPFVEFHETPFEEAIGFLRLRIRELDQETEASRKGVSFRIHFHPPHLNDHHSDDSLETPDHLDATRLVTLEAENISIAKVLNQICEQSSLHWEITDHGILIKPVD